MNIIVATDLNGGIGYQNQLLFHIKEDMEYFKNMTMDRIVVMGRKTFESLPNQKPLFSRINVILTTDKEYKVENALVYNSINDFIEKFVSNVDTNKIWVIGGANIYNQLLKYSTSIHRTLVDIKKEADTYFPKIDMKQWMPTPEDDFKIDEKTGLRYKIQTFVRY